MAIPEWLKDHNISHPEKVKFLKTFAVTSSINKSAEEAGIDRHTHYDWKKNDPDYLAAFQHAYEIAGDIIEDEAVRRAIEGVTEPVFNQGLECGVIQKYSDGLMARILAGRKRIYRDKTEVTGADGAPVIFQVVTGVIQPKPPDADPSH